MQDEPFLRSLAPDKPFAPYLLGIRKYFEKFGVVHKYHVNPVFQDNDLFIVLGTLNYQEWVHSTESEDTRDRMITNAEKAVREDLSSKPARFEIGEDNTYLVKYNRTSLTKISWIKRVVDVTPAEMRSLY